MALPRGRDTQHTATSGALHVLKTLHDQIGQSSNPLRSFLSGVSLIEDRPPYLRRAFYLCNPSTILKSRDKCKGEPQKSNVPAGGARPIAPIAAPGQRLHRLVLKIDDVETPRRMYLWSGSSPVRSARNSAIVSISSMPRSSFSPELLLHALVIARASLGYVGGDKLVGRPQNLHEALQGAEVFVDFLHRNHVKGRKDLVGPLRL